MGFRDLKPLKLLVSILLLSAALSGCTYIKDGESDMEYETKEMRIDSEFIKAGDSFQIIEPLWWSVSIYDGESKYLSDLSKYTTEQKYVFAMQWYIAEVNNGGHDQFYSNSTGIVWEDALNGFKEVGLVECAQILEESAKRMGGNPSKDRGIREDQLEKLEPDFEDLDRQFYDTKEPIEEKLMEYIKGHEDRFYFIGTVSIPK